MLRDHCNKFHRRKRLEIVFFTAVAHLRTIEAAKAVYRDRSALIDLFFVGSKEHFREKHKQWVETELKADKQQRKAFGSESIAVGSDGFVEKVQRQLRFRAGSRTVIREEEGSAPDRRYRAALPGWRRNVPGLSPHCGPSPCLPIPLTPSARPPLCWPRPWPCSFPADSPPVPFLLPAFPGIRKCPSMRRLTFSIGKKCHFPFFRNSCPLLSYILRESSQSGLSM